MRLHGKRAIVTGAAGGIGAATVKRLLADGAHVLGIDINPDIGAQMKSAGAHGLTLDLSRPESADRALEAAIECFGAADILINNAGVTKPAEFLDYTLEDFQWVMSINLVAPFLLGQAVARDIVRRGGSGAIVNVTSINAFVALPNQTAYVTSKGGLTQLTKVMAIALADKGIRVNAVAPGTIVTDMTRERILATEESRRRILSRTPLRRPGEASEIAAAVAFLASDDASYITGETLVADGGRLALNYTVPVD
jgi:glucose 1-dehydrogenase